jgi:P4 family phage/plasmid primase-like protien
MYEFVEKINVKNMMTIVSNFDYLYKQGLLNQKNEHNHYAEIVDYNSVKTILYKFLESHMSGECSVVYKPTKNNPKGRLFATQSSVQGISRRVRHTICADTMVDIDIKNAHPQFLLQLSKKHDMKYEALQYYIDHRKEILEYLVQDKTVDSLENAKTLILQIMNGGASLNFNWNSWLYAFYIEMKSVREKVCILYPKYYKMAVDAKGKDGFNIKGTCLNYILCEMERECLDKMVLYCKSNHLDIGVLCHDGLMLHKNNTLDYHDIARQLSGVIGMEVVVKEMNEGIPIENLDIKTFDSPFKQYEKSFIKEIRRTFADCWSSYNISRLILKADGSLLEKYNYAQTANGDGYWYELLYDGRWSETLDPLTLSTYLAENLYNMLTKVLETIEVEMKRQKNNPEKLKFLQKEYCDLKVSRQSWQGIGQRNTLKSELRADFLDNRFGDRIDSYEHLIGFDNGVYDLLQQQFRPIQPDDYIKKTTGYNFSTVSNSVKRKFLIDTLKSMFVLPYAKRQSLLAEGRPEEEWVDDPEGEEMYLFTMKVIASCLFGGNKYQKLYIMIGSASNGKSVMFDLIRKTFGDYFGTIDVSTLTKAKKNANEHSDLPNTRGQRIVSANESSANDTLQAELVKNTTGCDPLRCRDIYKPNITFIPQFKLFMLTNHTPKIAKMDDGIQRRIQLIYFPFKFFDSKNDPIFLEEEHNITHFLGKDPYLTDKLGDCCNEFFLYLLEIYYEYVKDAFVLEVPKTYTAKTSEFIDSQNTLKQFINDNYEPVIPADNGVINEMDCTTAKDLKIHYRNVSGNNLNDQQFSISMRKLGYESFIGKEQFTKNRSLYKLQKLR